VKRALFGMLLPAALLSAYAQADEGWRSEWAVDGPVAIEMDTTGFFLPTAMAFVPSPGSGPRDPLYFVVELSGGIKVVTNDRTVLDFASVPTVVPEAELPEPSAQLGAAGICLEESSGYVFVTFADRREGGTLGNRVVRFTTAPEVFEVVPRAVVEIAPILGTAQSAPSHQIGGCDVDPEKLIIGIGDGRDAAAASRSEDLLGKIVAMDLDGYPLATNPFSDDQSETARYVYAMGFRNPFAVGVFGGLVTVIDNGLSIDRLVIAEPGVDYLWDGSDASIAASATALIDPGAGAVHLDRSDPASFLGDGIFYTASSPREGVGGVWFFPFDFTAGHPTGKPRQLVRYVGDGHSAVTAIARGQDGIYFTPLLPDGTAESPVLKLVHRPNEPHPIAIAPSTQDLFDQLGCVTCHERDGTGGDVGPSLDFFHEETRNRLLAMIESDGFEEMLRKLDDRTDEPFVSTRDARAEVLSTSGLARLRAYVKHKALEPRFADPDAAMPQLGLTEEQAAEVASELATPWEIRLFAVEQSLRRWFPIPETRIGDILVGAILGSFALAVLVSLLGLARRLAPTQTVRSSRARHRRELTRGVRRT
jgi:hypothetical protein